jgi:hypothetical protein
MVKRSGKQGYRSFTVVDATNHGGCDTKSHGGRYISRSPFGAAKKAFNELCRVKKIRGVCTFIVTIKETTSESNKKLFTYKMHRKKLKEPLIRMEGTPNEFVIEYVVDGKKAKVHHSCKNKKQKTSGRMSKKTRRSSVLSANNARRVLNRLKKNRN